MIRKDYFVSVRRAKFFVSSNGQFRVKRYGQRGRARSADEHILIDVLPSESGAVNFWYNVDVSDKEMGVSV